jgi:hypothetical protein
MVSEILISESNWNTQFCVHIGPNRNTDKQCETNIGSLLSIKDFPVRIKPSLFSQVVSCEFPMIYDVWEPATV